MLTGGVSTLQILGSLRALLISIWTPSLSGSPSNWHKQIGLLSTNPASSGQHSLSGLVKLLPCSTNVKQLDMFTNTDKQSNPGLGAAGAIAIDGPEAAPIGDICASPDETRIENRRNVVAMAPVILVVEAIDFGGVRNVWAMKYKQGQRYKEEVVVLIIEVAWIGKCE